MSPLKSLLQIEVFRTVYRENLPRFIYRYILHRAFQKYKATQGLVKTKIHLVSRVRCIRFPKGLVWTEAFRGVLFRLLWREHLLRLFYIFRNSSRPVVSIRHNLEIFKHRHPPEGRIQLEVLLWVFHGWENLYRPFLLYIQPRDFQKQNSS